MFVDFYGLELRILPRRDGELFPEIAFWELDYRFSFRSAGFLRTFKMWVSTVLVVTLGE